MGKSIGIDFGNANCRMAVNKGVVRVLQNKENEDLTRSAVSLYKGQIIVGSPAVDIMVSFPKDIIISAKRLMDRKGKKDTHLLI